MLRSSAFSGGKRTASRARGVDQQSKFNSHEPEKRTVPIGRRSVWTLIQRAPWSVGMIGLLAYTFAVISYKYPIGTVSAATATVGALFVLPGARIPRPFQVLAAYLLWAAVTAATSHWASLSFDALLEFAKVIVVVIAASIVLRTLSLSLIALGWFVLCFVLFPIRGALIGGDTIVGRLVWNYIYSNPNDLAVLALLALGATLALAALSWQQRYLRPLLYASAVAELWVILRTQSRGAALGLLGVAATAIITAGPRVRRKLLVRGAVLLLVAAPFIPQESLNRYLGGTFASTEVEMDARQRIAFSSRQERLMINDASWKLASRNLAVGVGFGAFASALAEQSPELGARDTHDTYLNVLCETGLPGLGLLLLFLGMVAQEVRRGLAATRLLRPDQYQSLLLFASAVGGFWVAAIFGSYFKLVPPMLVMVLLVSYARALAQPGPGRPLT